MKQRESFCERKKVTKKVVSKIHTFRQTYFCFGWENLQKVYHNKGRGGRTVDQLHVKQLSSLNKGRNFNYQLFLTFPLLSSHGRSSSGFISNRTTAIHRVTLLFNCSSRVCQMDKRIFYSFFPSHHWTDADAWLNRQAWLPGANLALCLDEPSIGDLMNDPLTSVTSLTVLKANELQMWANTASAR